MKVVDRMVRCPDSAEQIWSSIDSGLVCGTPASSPRSSDGSKAGGVDDGADYKVTSFAKVETEMKAKTICSMSGAPTPQQLDLCDDKDPHAAHDIFYMMFGVSPKNRLPPFESEGHFVHTMRKRLEEI